MENTKTISKKPLCFTFKIGKRLDRIDCSWPNPEISNLMNKLNNIGSKSGYEIGLLREIAEVKGGKRLPKGTLYPETDFALIPYIRVTDIIGNKVNLSNCAYITELLHKTIQQYQLKTGNVVISIAGTIGEVGVFEEKLDRCNFNENMAKIVVKNEKQVDPYYLCYFLNSLLGKRQIERLTVGALQYKLSLASVRSIKIVYPKSLDVQKKIVGKVRQYENKAEERLKKYTRIIKEIKKIVPKKLGIVFPESKSKSFKLESNKIRDVEGRLDVPFNSPYLKELRNRVGLHFYDKLGNLVVMQKKGTVPFTDYYNLVDLDDIDGEIGEVTSIKTTLDLGSNKILFRKSEILISKLQPEKGKVIIVNENLDGCVGSSELIPVKLKNNKVTNEFLWIILRSRYVLDQWKYQITGSSRMRIGKEELLNTLIPIPKPKVQKEIVKETQAKLEMARQLKTEYEENIRRGKETFLEHLTEISKSGF